MLISPVDPCTHVDITYFGPYILSSMFLYTGSLKLINNETGSRSPCMRPRGDPAKMKNSTQTTLPHFNFSVTAELKDVTSRLIILIN